MPDWYAFMKAAKWLGVPPWELAKQSVVWRDWALICEAADQDQQGQMFSKLFG